MGDMSRSLSTVARSIDVSFPSHQRTEFPNGSQLKVILLLSSRLQDAVMRLRPPFLEQAGPATDTYYSEIDIRSRRTSERNTCQIPF
jgi:hypothetical protein